MRTRPGGGGAMLSHLSGIAGEGKGDGCTEGDVIWLLLSGLVLPRWEAYSSSVSSASLAGLKWGAGLGGLERSTPAWGLPATGRGGVAGLAGAARGADMSGALAADRRGDSAGGGAKLCKGAWGCCSMVPAMRASLSASRAGADRPADPAATHNMHSERVPRKHLTSLCAMQASLTAGTECAAEHGDSVVLKHALC